MPIWMYFTHPVMALTFIYQERYSREWDRELNRIMDADPNPEILEYTVKFNVDGKEYEIWIANRYYSYGHIHRVDGIEAPKKLSRRPSFKAMCRLARLEGEQSRAAERKKVKDFLDMSGLKK